MILPRNTIGKGKGKGQLTSINLLARLGSITPFLEADERKPLCTPRIPILGQKDPRDTAEALEDLTEVIFFGELGNVRDPERREVVPLVLPAHSLPRPLASALP